MSYRNTATIVFVAFSLWMALSSTVVARPQAAPLSQTPPGVPNTFWGTAAQAGVAVPERTPIYVAHNGQEVGSLQVQAGTTIPLYYRSQWR